MSGIDIFAWIVLIVIIVSVVAVFVALAMLPGKIAQARNHPQADAINAASWLGLLLSAGIFWAVAMVWALSKSSSANAADAGTQTDEVTTLKARIEELEARLEANGGESAS